MTHGADAGAVTLVADPCTTPESHTGRASGSSSSAGDSHTRHAVREPCPAHELQEMVGVRSSAGAIASTPLTSGGRSTHTWTGANAPQPPDSVCVETDTVTDTESGPGSVSVICHGSTVTSGTSDAITCSSTSIRCPVASTHLGENTPSDTIARQPACGARGSGTHDTRIGSDVPRCWPSAGDSTTGASGAPRGTTSSDWNTDSAGAPGNCTHPDDDGGTNCA